MHTRPPCATGWRLQRWIEVMLADCRDVWHRDSAHLASLKQMMRDAFKEWLYREKEEDTAGNEFCG
jgi:hypothetical protein